MSDAPATILRQLGAGAFIAMTGARDFLTSPYTLRFSLPRRFAAEGINRVEVTLRPDDTYNVTFGRYVQAELRVKPIHEHRNVPADNLRALFTRRTGLRTQL